MVCGLWFVDMDFVIILSEALGRWEGGWDTMHLHIGSALVCDYQFESG